MVLGATQLMSNISLALNVCKTPARTPPVLIHSHDPRKAPPIIQKYIHPPLLVGGIHKFCMRASLLLLSVDPPVLAFQQWYTVRALEKYDGPPPVGPNDDMPGLSMHAHFTSGLYTHPAFKGSKDFIFNGWDELGYHFVIGNGRGTPDGMIEVGSRWHKQKHGAHCKTPDNYFNNHGIGICLVGDFTKRRPSAAQMASLEQLVRFLSNKLRKRTFARFVHSLVHGLLCFILLCTEEGGGTSRAKEGAVGGWRKDKDKDGRNRSGWCSAPGGLR